MALPELAVMQQTFDLLHPLDPQARRRVLKWVKAALGETEPQPAPAPPTDPTVEPADEPVDLGTPAETLPAEADTEAKDTPTTPSGPEPATDRDEATTDPGPGEAPPTRRRRSTPKKAAPQTPRRATKKAAPAKASTARATADSRRGRPDADEIMRVYQEVGGKLTEVARHYGRPYPTIQGWASALRKQGYQIGRTRDF